MNTGKIIILNGVSSSGKTTLIKGLQDVRTEPFLEMGLDKFIWMFPKRYLDQPLWDQLLGQANAAGPLGNQMVYGMHRAIRAAAECGLNILADHVLLTREWIQDAAQSFADMEAYLIGVRCDLSILEAREENRRDRTLGQARLQYPLVHALTRYDFEIDSGEFSAQENIQQLSKFLDQNTSPRAFKHLKNSTFQHVP